MVTISAVTSATVWAVSRKSFIASAAAGGRLLCGFQRLRLLALGLRLVHRLRKSGAVEGAVVALPVDEKRRSAADSAAQSSFEVGADARGELLVLQRLAEGRGSKFQAPGKLQKQRAPQSQLIFKEQV